MECATLANNDEGKTVQYFGPAQNKEKVNVRHCHGFTRQWGSEGNGILYFNVFPLSWFHTALGFCQCPVIVIVNYCIATVFNALLQQVFNASLVVDIELAVNLDIELAANLQKQQSCPR